MPLPSLTSSSSSPMPAPAETERLSTADDETRENQAPASADGPDPRSPIDSPPTTTHEPLHPKRQAVPLTPEQIAMFVAGANPQGPHPPFPDLDALGV